MGSPGCGGSVSSGEAARLPSSQVASPSSRLTVSLCLLEGQLLEVAAGDPVLPLLPLPGLRAKAGG